MSDVGHDTSKPIARTRWISFIRFLFTGACILSGVLSLASLIFGIRSVWIHDLPQIAYRWYPEPLLHRMRWLSIRSTHARLEFGVVRNDYDLRYPRDISSAGGEPNYVSEFLEKNPGGFVWTYYTSSVKDQSEIPKSLVGFELSHKNSVNGTRHDEYWHAIVPSWFAVIVFGLLPGFRLWTWNRQRKRKRDNLCLKCGYDLRESPDRCPECGAAVDHKGSRHPDRNIPVSATGRR